MNNTKIKWNEFIRKLPEKNLSTSKLNFENALIFTDDFAPIEYLTYGL